MAKWFVKLGIVAVLGLATYGCGPQVDEGSTDARSVEATDKELEDVQKGTSGYDTSSGAEYSTDIGESGLETGPEIENGKVQRDTGASNRSGQTEENM